MNMEVADEVSGERSGRRRGVGERGHPEFDETFYRVGYGGSAHDGDDGGERGSRLGGALNSDVTLNEQESGLSPLVGSLLGTSVL